MTKWFLLISSVLLIGVACSKDAPAEANQPEIDPTLAEINQLIDENPENSEAYLARAQFYYDREGYDEAIADLQRSLILDSTNINSLHLLADAYLDYFQSRPALQTMERAAELYPERIPTLLKLSEFQLILKQYEASMKTINRILKIDPQNAEAYFMFGLNFLEQQDTGRAVNSFQTAVENDPELLDGWLKLGELQAALGNRIAETYFTSAIRIAPDNPTVYHAKADYLSDQNDLEGALEVYRELIKVDPSYETSYYNSGLLYLDLDSIAQAYKQFDLCIKFSPLHIRAYYYRGLAAEMQGRLAQAKADYEQALSLAPDYEDARAGLIRVNSESQQ